MALSPYLEDLDSQIPAVQVLHALGWKYLSREEAVKLRNGRLDQVVLTGILKPWIEQNNRFDVKGEGHLFSEANIAEAIRRLLDEPYVGLVRTNEQIYHLLTLGTSLDQTVEGDRKGRQLHFVNWKHPEYNIFHVTDEFVVERTRSHETCRPDLVLFVNGIPFVVIECKRRDQDKKQIEVAIEQQIRNQRDDWIPKLFQYAQLLIGTSVNETRYGTVGTRRKLWSVWREEGRHDQAVHATANQRLPPDVEAKLFAPTEPTRAHAYRDARKHFEQLWAEGDRLPTEQDRTLWAMLRPERLLDLAYGFVVFDAGVRKIARYQQYFAVKETLKRAAVLREGRRSGGVVWHTTGSGKSITMVMLAKALALHPAIASPRVVIVTDRIDLDDQIWRTFDACGKKAEKARTGEHLVSLITENKATVITTIIDKFRTAMKKFGVRDRSPDIFVLVDESHRSNYGTTAAQMRRVFPNACYIGFTGTPLLKREKSTAQKFGGFIHSYSMRQAVEDEAVAPLLYEGRLVSLEQNQEAMQAWFDRITRGLSEQQKADLKRKMARKEVINQAEQRLRMIAFDVGEHYRKNFKGTGFKAQLAADSRPDAIVYRQAFRDFSVLDAEVIMSQPELRKGGESTEEEDTPAVVAFWQEMMKRFGSEEEYNKQLLASFGREDGLDLIIVIDKLLTGFDEPRNTVLYIDKQLREHSILQAIARVNRIMQGKEFGYIIDYRGILGNLNEAINVYEALAGFDPADVDLTGAVTDTHAEVATLPQKHADLCAVFKEVRNKRDTEALEQHLRPEDVRHDFYEALAAYAKTLSAALCTEHFYTDTAYERIETYKDDLKFFRSLRRSVQQRYAEVVDYSDYEKQIRKVMDSHIQAPDVAVITELVNIFDAEAFDREVGKREGAAAKADTIASRLKKTITERMEEDPVFYAKFAKLVQQAIDEYRQGRIAEIEYLKRVTEVLETVRRGHEADLPEKLKGHQQAQAYYGVVREAMEKYETKARQNVREISAEMALAIESIVEEKKIRDWATNEDAVKRIEDAIDDYLFETPAEYGVKLDTDDIDTILHGSLGVAKKISGR
jgi:type I restriction enzyme R subunit